MSLTDKSIDAISDQLFLQKKPITYKVLSRKLGISNHESKSLLEQYYDKYKDERDGLQPTYILIGMHRHVQDEEENGDYGEDSGSILIKLCRKVELEDAKKQFSNMQSCFIYSLNDGDIPLDNIVVANETISEVSSDQKMTFGLETPTAGKLSLKEKAEIISTTKDLEVKNEIVTHKKSSSVSKKVENVKKEKPGKDPFALYHSRKKEVEQKSNVTLDKIRQDDFEKSHKRQMPARKKAKVFSQKRQQHEDELSKMFADDVDDKSGNEDGDSRSIPIEVEGLDTKPSEMKKASTEQEDALEGKVINDFLSNSTQKTETSKEDNAVKTYVDKDGYMVAVKDDDNSKANSRASSRPKRKAAKAKNHVISEKGLSRKRKKKSASNQTSLMSFFGKKR